MKWSALHALFLAPILLVAVVCEDESAPQAVPTTATRTVTPVGLAPTISTRPADGDFGPDDPAYALDQRSGIGPVDAAIAAILSGDSEAVRKLLIPLSLKCSLEPSGGFPQPPKCLPGMSDGSIVEAFPVGGPEGSYVLAAECRHGISLAPRFEAAPLRCLQRDDEQRASLAERQVWRSFRRFWAGAGRAPQCFG